MKWPRGRSRASIGVAAGLAAFVATAVFALTQNGSAGPSQQLPRTAAVGPLGPEGVPIPDAPLLARARPITNEEKIDGITCQAREQVLVHTHTHLTIFIRGTARQVPAAIGIASPRAVEENPAGAFVSAGTCFMWLHTHAADGIIHTESPIERTYTLGEFFDIWGQPLDREHVGPEDGPVTVFLNGRLFAGNPRRLPLLAHAQIQLEVGKPLVRPEQLTFPTGL
jgi:hypothetical protein